MPLRLIFTPPPVLSLEPIEWEAEGKPAALGLILGEAFIGEGGSVHLQDADFSLQLDRILTGDFIAEFESIISLVDRTGASALVETIDQGQDDRIEFWAEGSDLRFRISHFGRVAREGGVADEFLSEYLRFLRAALDVVGEARLTASSSEAWRLVNQFLVARRH